MTGGTETESSVAELKARVTTLERERDEAEEKASTFYNLSIAESELRVEAEARGERLEAALTQIRDHVGGDDPGYHTVYVIARKALEVAVSSSDTPTPTNGAP